MSTVGIEKMTIIYPLTIFMKKYQISYNVCLSQCCHIRHTVICDNIVTYDALYVTILSLGEFCVDCGMMTTMRGGVSVCLCTRGIPPLNLPCDLTSFTSCELCDEWCENTWCFLQNSMCEGSGWFEIVWKGFDDWTMSERWVMHDMSEWKVAVFNYRSAYF